MRRAAGFVITIAFVPALLAAQRPLAERLRAVGTGTVAFSAPARPEVCGDGIRSYNDGLSGPTTRYFDGYMLLTYEQGDTHIAPCEKGPVRVTVRMVEGAPSWMRITAGPLVALGDSVTDLGMMPASEAAAYLGALVRTGQGRASTSALQPLVLIDSVSRWDVLVAAARDSTKPASHRRRATDLLARAAAWTIAGDASMDDEERSARREAVYALARKRESGEDVIPVLLDIAQKNQHRDARVAALHELGQTTDRRAIDLFAGILGGRR
ncbi:MAG: HEAT repeat domain-containing protein [Gemmatimonadaceae bacterium]